MLITVLGGISGIESVLEATAMVIVRMGKDEGVNVRHPILLPHFPER